MDIIFPTQPVCTVQLHSRDEDRWKVRTTGGLQKIGGDIDFIVVWEENAGFVEERIIGGPSCRQQKRMCRRSPNEIAKASFIL
jgi:hypothetical protein